MNFKEIYICAPKRTAIGSFQGALSMLSASDLGAQVVQAVLKESGAPSEKIDELIMGCVLSAGVGQAPARQVVVRSGLPYKVQAMTVNKVCSSGLKAVMLAAQSIECGHARAVIAGGMESMSQAPYLMPTLRNGARLGNTEACDSIIKDALWDVYNNYHMGNAAELCAKQYKISREEQDRFAIESYTRAKAAIENGVFNDEIVPIKVQNGKVEVEFRIDEEPSRAKLEKIPQLKPVFEKDGTVTAANASSINDGAAAMLVCSAEYAREHSLSPVARIIAQAWNAQEPAWFTTAPIGAVENLLKRAQKKLEEVDLFEINEAFSAVAIVCSNKLQIEQQKLNIRGGAVALGHPVGASGARILTTLIYALKHMKLKTGVAAICNGGGEATALMVELV